MLRLSSFGLKNRYLQNLAVYKTRSVETSTSDVNSDVFDVFSIFDSNSSTPVKPVQPDPIQELNKLKKPKKPKKGSRLVLDSNSSKWRLATYAEKRLKSTPKTEFLTTINNTIQKTAFTYIPAIYSFKIKTYKNHQFTTEEITNSKSKNQHKFLQQLAVYRKVITNPRKTFTNRDNLLVYKQCLPSGKPTWWKKSMDQHEYEQANFDLFMQSGDSEDSEGKKKTSEVSYENLENALYEKTFQHFFDIELTRQFLPKDEENMIFQENKGSVGRNPRFAVKTVERVFMNKLTDSIRKKRKESIMDIAESTDLHSEKTLADFLVIDRIEELRTEKNRIEVLAKIARERFCEKKQRRINLRKLGLDKENVENLFENEFYENDHFEEFDVDGINSLGVRQLGLLTANLEVRGYFEKISNSKIFDSLSRKKKHAFCQNWLIEYFEGASVVDDDIYLSEVDFENVDRKIYSEREVREMMAAKKTEKVILAEIIQKNKPIEQKNSGKINKTQVATLKNLNNPKKLISADKFVEFENDLFKRRHKKTSEGVWTHEKLLGKTNYYKKVQADKSKLKSITDDIIGDLRQNKPKARISPSSGPIERPSHHKYGHRVSHKNNKQFK